MIIFEPSYIELKIVELIEILKNVNFRESIIHEIEIDYNELDEKYYYNDIRYSNYFEKIFTEINKHKGSLVYWFEIVSKTNSLEIIDNLIKYKSKEGSRNTPVIKNKIDINSKILYLGKVKNNFEVD